MQYACIAVTATHNPGFTGVPKAIDIGIVVLDYRGRILRTFDTLVDPGDLVANRIPGRILNTLDLHANQLAAAPTFVEVLPQIVDVLSYCSAMVEFNIDEVSLRNLGGIKLPTSSQILQMEFHEDKQLYPGIEVDQGRVIDLHATLNKAGVATPDTEWSLLDAMAEQMGVPTAPAVSRAAGVPINSAFVLASVIARMFAECLQRGYFIPDPQAGWEDVVSIENRLTRARLRSAEGDGGSGSRLSVKQRSACLEALGWQLVSVEEVNG
jgi:DNA polymerase III epsilon subunit-like protein